MPYNNKSSFTESTSEWTPSEIIAELLLMPPAINFVTAIAILATSAR
ncbi:MAG TPA: hypothetical protein VK563_19125 [Puia sp.]|nr:hypothetical protein [Puia sp.]